MALTALIRALLTLVRQSLLLRLQTKLSVVMVSRFLWHVMSLPVEFFTQRHAGDISNRVGANEQIGRLLSSGVASNALNLTSIVFFAAAMAIYDLPLAIIGVSMTLANVLALQVHRRDAARISAAASRSSKASSSAPPSAPSAASKPSRPAAWRTRRSVNGPASRPSR